MYFFVYTSACRVELFYVLFEPILLVVKFDKQALGCKPKIYTCVGSQIYSFFKEYSYEYLATSQLSVGFIINLYLY